MRASTLFVALPFVPAILSAQVVSAAVDPHANVTGIVATGVGEVRARPTRAVVHFTVETGGQSGVLAASEITVQRRRVLDTLSAMGYQVAEVPTYAYAVGATAELPMRPTGPAGDRFTGLTGLQVTVSPVSKLDDVVHAILWVGATRIQLVAFETDDPEARARAIEEAVTRAQRDAEAMARAAGGRLGDLIQLSTYPDLNLWSNSQTYALQTMSMRGPTLVPSDVAVRVSVYGRWEFRPR